MRIEARVGAVFGVTLGRLLGIFCGTNGAVRLGAGKEWVRRGLRLRLGRAVVPDGQARSAFARGIERFPEHLPLYHAWALMEAETGNATRVRR